MNTVFKILIAVCGIVVALGSQYTLRPVIAQTQPQAWAQQDRRIWSSPQMTTTGIKDPATDSRVDFPLGTATPSEVCGQCHGAIYFEHAFGFGADLKWKPIIYRSPDEALLSIPAPFADTGTAHHLAGVDPWPLRARDVENGGASCNVCHYPQPLVLPDLNTPVITNPVPRPRELEATGVTCASCHLTPEGAIRGSYGAVAPHQSVLEPKLRTSVMCAYCHSAGIRVIGKQTQTFYEWRDDFYNAGLGQQHCQDCHMPRTVRVLAEGYNTSARVVGRHLWTGDHSPMRIGQGLTLTILQTAPAPATPGPTTVEFHVVNVAAGHSVPTGSNRRAVYLDAQVLDGNGNVVASQEWLFAPWYGNRPDDRAFLQEDQTRPDAIAASQADAQGPHEPSVRAGEDRVLVWQPDLSSGDFTVSATLTYDLNRYNDPAFLDDQTQLLRISRAIHVP